MLAILLLLSGDPDGLIAVARTVTAAEHRCLQSHDTTDVTVCGLRGADRFRVPFVVHDAGDPRYEGVRQERERLLHRTTPIDDLTPFLVGGGMAGASVGTGGVHLAGERRLAP